MADEGHGYPPVPYCRLAMGSEGRQEQTLLTDQDNALLYKDVPNGEDDQVKGWFLRLSRRIVDALDRYGMTSGNKYFIRQLAKNALINKSLLFEPALERLHILTARIR